MPWDITYLLKLHEPAKYATEVHLGAPLHYAITINNDTWSKLSPEVQKVFLEVAAEAEQATVARVKADDAKAIGGMKDAGSEFYTLPDAEIAKWVASLDEVPAGRAKEADDKGLPGTKLIKRYIELTTEYGQKYPREWKFE